MATTSLRQIAEMNNNGATMLVSERDKDAFDTLQAALRIMERQMLRSDQEEQETQPPRDSTHSTGSTTTTTTSSSSSKEPQSEQDEVCQHARFSVDTKCSTEIPNLKDERFFIFNQALLVSVADDFDVSNCSQAMICFYTSVIIFNLGMLNECYVP